MDLDSDRLVALRVVERRQLRSYGFGNFVYPAKVERQRLKSSQEGTRHDKTRARGTSPDAYN